MCSPDSDRLGSGVIVESSVAFRFDNSDSAVRWDGSALLAIADSALHLVVRGGVEKTCLDVGLHAYFTPIGVEIRCP